MTRTLKIKLAAAFSVAVAMSAIACAPSFAEPTKIFDAPGEGQSAFAMSQSGAYVLASVTGDQGSNIRVAGGNVADPFPAAIDIPAGGRDDGFVDAKVLDDGTWFVGWQACLNRVCSVHIARYSPGDAEPTVSSMRLPIKYELSGIVARLAVGSRGDAILVWTRAGRNRNDVRAAFMPAGGSLEPVRTIVSNKKRAEYVDAYAAIDPNGIPTVAWYRGYSPCSTVSGCRNLSQTVQYAEGNGLGGFGAPTAIVGATNCALGDFSASASGAVVIALSCLSRGHAIVRASSRPAGGSFGPAARISHKLRGYSVVPASMVATDDTAYVVWSQQRNAPTKRNKYQRIATLYASSWPAGAPPARPQPMAEPAPSASWSDSDVAYFVWLTPGAAGKPLLVGDFPGRGNTSSVAAVGDGLKIGTPTPLPISAYNGFGVSSSGIALIVGGRCSGGINNACWYEGEQFPAPTP